MKLHLIFIIFLFPLLSFSAEIPELKLFLCKEINGNKTITVKKGEHFLILLETQLSTGFDWVIKKPLPNNLQLLDEFILYREFEKKVGGYEFHAFKFIGIEKGNFSISFEYKRKWEKEPIKIKKIKISVE